MARNRPRPSVSGILLLDKPAGITSARAVARIKRLLGGPKVGHLGTLDPFATGLLPLCIGQGTKIAPYLNEADKGYRGTIRLGVVTDTDDVTGQIQEETEVPAVTAERLEEIAEGFRGEISQIPPIFSAIKKDGRPMYELARKGEMPVMEPREVRIDRLELSVLGPCSVGIDVECSKGTYVRALARDIGRELGCGGALESLERTRFGSFLVEDSVSLDDLEEEGAEGRALAAIVPVAEALAHLPRFEVDGPAAAALRNGRGDALTGLGPPREGSERARVLVGTELVAVVSAEGARWRLDRVFPASV